MAVRTINFFGAYSTFRPFILTVDSGADARYTIPTAGTGYNYSVNTSDGQFFNGVTGNQLILFPLANTLYDIEIRGLFPRIYINSNAERLKPKDIKQWGDVVMGANQSFAYYGASDVTCTATDNPRMELVTNAQQMFHNALKFNPQNFNVTLSLLTNGFGMFYYAQSFNPLNFKPTFESLVDCYAMFYYAISFTQDIYAPNSVNVTNEYYFPAQTKISKITMNNTSLVSPHNNAYQCPLLTDLILTGRKVSLRIVYSPLLVGIKIDNLFTSLGTANTGATITLTAAQNSSGITASIATLKGWNIIVG